MIRRIALPLAGLLAVAGAVGLYLGLLAAPPSETAIINAQAALYVAETGGALTECYAVPSDLAEVRLIIVCEPEDGPAWYRAVDTYGRVVAVDDALEGPQT